MDFLEMIKTRRSTRKYRQVPVDRQTLDRIIEAGRYAPSGGNSQTARFIVVTNKEVMAELAETVKNEFSKMEVTPGMYRSIAGSINAAKAGSYVFHFNAPVLVIMANKIDYGNSMADCACAIENMMLAANAMDMGSCWINQLRWLTDNENILRILYRLGMKEDERVFGAVAIGYPDTESGLPARTPLERKGNEVVYVD